MVPQHTNPPDDPQRALSPEVHADLSKAIVALTSSGSTPEVSEMLKGALEAAGRDARERNLKPEELILAFKAIERRLSRDVPEFEDDGKIAIRSGVIRALLEAYYKG